jgi:YfiH family protein
MRSSDFVVNLTGGIRWLSFPPLDAHPFILHGLVIKNQNIPSDVKTKEVENFLQKITSSKRMLVSVSQRHQDECVIITSKDKLKKGYKGDALLTDRKDIFISVCVADCLPIFLVEKKRRMVGLVHAGWRGTLLGIVQKTLEKAQHQLGCKPGDFTVLFGPCIQSCCYQVSDDVAILFAEECMSRSKHGRFMLDLIRANLKQLIGCGVKEDRIFATKSCTCCDKKLFHSYRRERENAGRMIAFLGLK